MPGFEVMLGAASPDHQSHADFPALIQDVSANLRGRIQIENECSIQSGGRARRRSSTRGQGVVTGALASTRNVGCVDVRRQLRVKCEGQLILPQVHSRIVCRCRASVTATQPTPETSCQQRQTDEPVMVYAR